VYVLIALFSIIWFGSLDFRPLIPSDEARYAEIAREMYVTGDWITPRYNGYKYFEKPPLQMWATSVVFEIFGVGNWQARLWSALTGFLTIVFVGITSTKLFNSRVGWLSSIILASSPMWIIAGHLSSLDIALSSFLAAALCSLLLSQHSENSNTQRNWVWLCWTFMALAVLSKGLIGIVLPTLVLIFYCISIWDWKILNQIRIISGSLIFLIITAPWFVLVSIKNPEFLEFFFIHEHFQRFAQNSHNRNGPIYFFIPLLLVGILPWVPQLPMAFMSAIKRTKNSYLVNRLLICWVVVIFVFFSISSSKLPGYIIPIFPAIAILIAKYLDSIKYESFVTLWRFQTIFFAALGLAGFYFLPEIDNQARPDEFDAYNQYAYWIAAALLAMIVFSLMALLKKTLSFQEKIATYACGFFLCSMIAGTGHETLDRASSGIELAKQIKSSVPKGINFYSIQTMDNTLPFYLGITMTMVQNPYEFEFGIKQEPHLWIPTIDDFIVRWGEDSSAFALMQPGQFTEFQKKGLPMQEVGRDTRRVIVKHPDIHIQ
jgi:4-amino-4-deoxy-L-arabinose transferase-like glycosyltransferase